MQAFASIVGDEHVVDPDQTTLAGAKVLAAVRPGTAGEVAACLGAARTAGVPLLVRGGGSKLGWGNPLDGAELCVLDLGRLDSEPELQPDEGIVRVAAGVALDALARAAAERGARTSLEPLFPGATVGGTIAADPLGPGASLERQLRNDLLGLEVALANGELTRAGGQVVKNVTGFDLVRLYCGSLGTLGVITHATLRLRSAPPVQRVLRRDFGDRGEALAAAAELRLARVEVGGLAVRPDGSGARLLWLLEGSEAAVAEFERRFPGDATDAQGWDEVGREIGAPERDEADVRVRIGARASEVSLLCDELERAAGAEALRLALPRAGVVLGEVAPERLGELWERVAERRWALFLERRPEGVERDAFGPEPEGLSLMRALKRRFDPDRVLAPGRFVGRI